MSYYFAYGSNMNFERMSARDLQVLSACSGWLEGIGLRFNKRSRRDATLACANVVYAPRESVESVWRACCIIWLFQQRLLSLTLMRGTPFMYSRESFQVQTISSLLSAWTYIANPAVIDNTIRPARWYVEYLLAGKAFLTPEYWVRMDQTSCRETVDVIW